MHEKSVSSLSGSRGGPKKPLGPSEATVQKGSFYEHLAAGRPEEAKEIVRNMEVQWPEAPPRLKGGRACAIGQRYAYLEESDAAFLLLQKCVDDGGSGANHLMQLPMAP